MYYIHKVIDYYIHKIMYCSHNYRSARSQAKRVIAQPEPPKRVRVILLARPGNTKNSDAIAAKYE